MTTIATPKVGWIDMTIRPEGDPEVEFNDLTGEFEFTWPQGDSGRLTILLPRDTVQKAYAATGKLLGSLLAMV